MSVENEDADVVVVNVATSEFEVGRPGAVKLSVLSISGQTSRPQARSVGQQPPPREAGQERKPEEHISVFGAAEVLGGDVAVGLVVSVVVVIAVEGGGGGSTVVVVVSVSVSSSVVDDGGGGVGGGRGAEDVEALDVVEGVGATTTTAVEVATQPTSKHAYPGRQHPPLGLVGHFVYPPSGQFDTDPAHT